MTNPVEVTVLNPSYWANDVPRLAHILKGRIPSRIPKPDGGPADPEPLTLVDPGYWAAQLRELQEVLSVASGDSGPRSRGDRLGAGAAPDGALERLTLTVEEAAKVLGISRAFAYESVRRQDLPSVRIGRRILIPKSALERLLDAAMPAEPEDPDPS